MEDANGVTDKLTVEIHFITDMPVEDSECLLYDVQTGMWINYAYFCGAYHDKYGEPMYSNHFWRFTHWMHSPKPTQRESVGPDRITTYDKVALVRAGGPAQ